LGTLQSLQDMLEEQALTDWEFQEKFDSYRVRLKRPVSARSGDSMLPEGIDPYSTSYGFGDLSGKFSVLLVVGLLLLFVGLAVFFIGRW